MFKNPDPSEEKEALIPDYHLSTEYRPYGGHSALDGGGGAAPTRCRPAVVRRPAPELQTPARQRPAPAAAPAATAAAVPTAAAAATVPATAANSAPSARAKG